LSNKILLDTIALWGLVFINSKYHEPVVKLIRGNHVIIHSICFHELLYPAYKLESNAGQNLEAGMKLIRDLRKSYDNIVKNYPILNIKKLTIIHLTIDHLLDAYKLVLEEGRIFIEEREGYWPSIVDAVIASTWRNLKIKLITNDRKLIRYGDKYKLPYKRILS